MALFSWSMQVIQRSKGHSVVAAAAYRSGERLKDERKNIVHDYRRRSGVEHKEILVPNDAPSWVRSIDRESLWNLVEASEKRKDARLARELRIMIPRELDPPERIRLVREYLEKSFVAHGMLVDVCFHNKIATDGIEQPHAHALITLRVLNETGFGLKSRHDLIPDPTGLTHPDGRPVTVESNPDSWNGSALFDQWRANWEVMANKALEDAGSDQRIDRRSLLARGFARIPEPALRLANYLDELWGVMKDRFGTYLVAKHHREVEERANAAFASAALPSTDAADAATTHERFFGWIERQLNRLAPAPEQMPVPEPLSERQPPTEQGFER